MLPTQITSEFQGPNPIQNKLIKDFNIGIDNAANAEMIYDNICDWI